MRKSTTAGCQFDIRILEPPLVAGVRAESSEMTSCRCYGCFRPTAACFCDRIPRIDNQTEVFIVQHPRERRHPFNTARIVTKSLVNAQLVVGYPRQLSASRLPIRSNSGLLFPGGASPVLSELPPQHRPRQLVVVDGTWHHAKTIVRDVPQLNCLPRFRLAPSMPGRYRIRREPNDQSLSTLEAVVAALSVSEPNTTGLQDLLAAFETMVDHQLAHPNMKDYWRRNLKRSGDGCNTPRAFAKEPTRLVVAYGEAASCTMADRTVRAPIYWVAERFGTGEKFEFKLMPAEPLGEQFLGHLQLSAVDFETSCSVDAFRAAWGASFERTTRSWFFIRGLSTYCVTSMPLVRLTSCSSRSVWALCRQ